MDDDVLHVPLAFADVVLQTAGEFVGLGKAHVGADRHGEILAEAAEIDRREDGFYGSERGDELPEPLHTGAGRRKSLRDAKGDRSRERGQVTESSTPARPSREAEVANATRASYGRAPTATCARRATPASRSGARQTFSCRASRPRLSCPAGRRCRQ